jgi:ArsR family transcriptional regulator
MTEATYAKLAKAFKALSDPKRVKIVDLLSQGEMCGCRLLKDFDITQPTLAHDMKVLKEAGVVKSRREGQKTMYSLDWKALERMNIRVMEMLEHKPQEKRAEPE